MEVTATNLAGINKSFLTLFNKGMLVAPGFYKKLCMQVPSSAAENVYGWLAALPAVGKIIGEYNRHRLQSLGYRLTNETYGNIIEVKRESIEDDQYNMFGPVASMNGQRAAQVPDIELLTLLVNAFSATKGKDYTGSAFFDADKKAHAKATAFTNKETKKLSAENFSNAIANLRERQDAAGVPLFAAMDPAQLYLVVCADDEAAGDAIVNLPTLANGAANPNYKKAVLLVLPGLQTKAQAAGGVFDGTALPWFLLDCSQAVKPLIYQPRVPFELTANFALTSDRVFNEDVFSWKTRGRMALGYGLPEFAFGSTGKDAA